ncbi:hypothetical protein EVAR_77852_1 [Eumeta japonica]|uniref:Uncharacterized protein n=1 Tax=Eumeta variegata TaxID=151549 RepID=A0A4C1TC55_EUMVA|nr:hypothetical protein EVAR_77852_1 [Eumeta japonica]
MRIESGTGTEIEKWTGVEKECGDDIKTKSVVGIEIESETGVEINIDQYKKRKKFILRSTSAPAELRASPDGPVDLRSRPASSAAVSVDDIVELLNIPAPAPRAHSGRLASPRPLRCEAEVLYL